jgi:NAD(P)-dependent dehydrogenase (short-subunit alcohol dehydrogenase family)
MAGICDGRVVIVTGAGRGLGRAHALEFARQGAKVVVNDYGVAIDGGGRSSEVADAVVQEIKDLGGEAVANADDVADWAGAENLVNTALNAFGGLHTLVNNAGFLRDRMLVNMSEEEWDLVTRVHLKGHFAPLRHAAAYWRAQSKAGTPVAARVINTSSGAGLQGSIGQGNYGAAKAGIAAMTIQAAAEMGRFGVMANAIAPSARTRMTEGNFDNMGPVESGFDAMDPGNVSPLVVWLGSELCTVSGRVFEVEGGQVAVADGWHHGTPIDKGARWEPEELTEVVQRLIADAPAPDPVYGAG